MPNFARLTLWAALALTGGLPVGLVSAPAQAQTMIDAGKSGAQLYASDCAACHDTPRALVKSGPRELAAFLREHYTASRETAALLADYLVKLAGAQNEPPPRHRARRAAPQDGKAAERKPAAERAPAHPATPRARSRRGEPAAPAAKPGEAKSGDSKPAETKPVEAKPAEAKPVEAKPVEAKPVEDKPVQAKPAEPANPAASQAEPPAAASPAPKAEPAPAASDVKPADPPASPPVKPAE